MAKDVQVETESINELTLGLIKDLRDLRAGKISNTDARTRAIVAREVLRGVQYYLQGVRLIESSVTKRIGS